MRDRLDDFTRAYMEAALWSSTYVPDGAEEPVEMDGDFDISDIAEATAAQMVEDCRAFQERHADLLVEENFTGRIEGSLAGMAGHDFWLTRNGHGAGFWDGDWVQAAGDALTRASNELGEYDLYVGDDRKIHGPTLDAGLAPGI